jgi:hypothetical protein
MVPSENRRDSGDNTGWTLSALGYDDGAPVVTRVRDLSPAEVEKGRASMKRIRSLARQAAFERVLESAERWKRLVARAAAELHEAGEISRQAQAAASAELAVFVLTAERFQDDLRNNTVAIDGWSDQDREQLDRILSEVRSADYFVLLREIARSDGSDLLYGSGEGTALRLLEANGPDAEDAVVAVVGVLGELIHPLLIIFRETYESDAAPFKAMASEVEAGIPALVRIEENPGKEGAQMSYTELPMYEMAVIDQALTILDRGDPHSAIGRILRGRERTLVFFGEVSAGSALIDGNAKEGLNDFPNAKLELDADLVGSEPIDYWSQVSFGYQRSEFVDEKFEGVVQRGVVEDRRISLDCEGAAALTEHMIGGMVAANIMPAELIESMIAQSGWEGELRLSEEAGEPCEEEFEVIVPLQGLSVREEIPVGDIAIVPASAVSTTVATLDLDINAETGMELAANFHRGSAYAVARVITDRPHLAEDKGLAAIDTAIAWFVVRGRYGLAKLPDGTPQEFSRQERLHGPRRGSVVLVRGTDTARQWLRRPDLIGNRHEIELSDQSSLVKPGLPSELSVGDRQALLALRAAATESDPFAQVQALWQAIESYVAGTKCRPLFDSEELEVIRDALPDSLTEFQRDTLVRAIAGLNDPPLRVKLDQRIRQEGVPVTEDELGLLKRLRDARNAAVHGRSRGKPPSRDEIHHGIAIVSRMLVYRIGAGRSASPLTT